MLRMLVVSLLMILAGPTLAQPFDTPEDLLEAFYAPYFDGEFAEDDTVFRSSGLQALYERDEDITPDGEMGAISFDPYVDGQDFDLADFMIGAVEVDGEFAQAEVSFTNFGELRELVYFLVWEQDGWRIDDVASISKSNPYRLSDIFDEAAGF